MPSPPIEPLSSVTTALFSIFTGMTSRTQISSSLDHRTPDVMLDDSPAIDT